MPLIMKETRDPSQLEEGVPLLNDEKETESSNHINNEENNYENLRNVIVQQARSLKDDEQSSAVCIGIFSIILITLIVGCFYWMIQTIISALTSDAGSNFSYNDWSEAKFAKSLEDEARYMKKLLMNNIGPKIGALDGIVVASPSKGEEPFLPDYYYTWTRDSALVHSSLLPSFLSNSYLTSYEWAGPLDDSTENFKDFRLHEDLLRAYIRSQIMIQNGQNPSGGMYNGGLNEPKFNVDGTPFTADWGRPQRDGPALRAMTLIPYAHYLLDRGFLADKKYVKANMYDTMQKTSPGRVIKNDLEEVANGWWKEGFDLWEEVNGYHFFTLIVSMRALQAGATLAHHLNDTGAQEFYSQQAEDIGKSLDQFWKANHGYYVSSLSNLSQERSPRVDLPDREWKDCSLPLSVIHAGDHTSNQVPRYPNISVPYFSATSPQVIATLYKYIQSFDGLYKINSGKSWSDGWALGRYKEDVYDGVGKSTANPWHICTNTIAQSFYLAQQQYYLQGHIEVTNLTQRFWTDVMKNQRDISENAKWSMGTSDFNEALIALRRTGDAFLNISRSATEVGNGRMSEQIDKDNGKPRGARDLTWSYSSFMTAVKARQDSVILIDHI
ncbi:uncharacterized protein I206_107766 [Kwoniella pini CBS 10737]|uniref:glucan 1,4-alpha-glucosidase n=1 Tax=Kwoniella pini CBS 10737 TaxID=1296096 RepID=A0A1B9HYA1_9TREE|nr:uncharacterized protein I206_06099 [Kwoniella pini CBS 10737]OCF48231.1 hypothetical protein I206_06099 [Kwoniella pini CBS 10737]